MAEARHRLFFALLPEPAVLDEIVAAAGSLIERGQPEGRVVAAGRLHLTLAFLGEFPVGNTDVLERAKRAGGAVTARSFDLLLDSAVSFGGRRPPWVLRSDPNPELTALRSSLLDRLREQDFRLQDAAGFVAHLTLLRDAIKALAPVAISPIRWPVDNFVLIDSRTQPVPEYVVLARWPLGERDDD